MKEKAEKIKKKITGQRILRISVNSFLYFVIGILLILLIAFGFSQTSVFRTWLKDTIVEELNASMNGKLSIQELEGTIFTSLVLKNTLLTQYGDTVFTSEHIEVKTSPLKLLFKIIYLRKVEIRNTTIFLREDSTGTLNISSLFQQSEKEDEDTTSSHFPFSFQVADLHLKGINFSLQEYSRINSNENYESMNLADLRVKDLNLRLSAFADLNSNNYQVSISEFSFFPNFKFFNLRSFEGEFFATESGVLINDLRIVTEESDIFLNAGITDINLFSDFNKNEIGEAPLKIQLESEKFSFYDVSTFSPGLDFINGKLSFELTADGSLNDLLIDKFSAGFNNTFLKLEGELKNIIDIDKFNIDANLNGSVIESADLAQLFSSKSIPDYSDFGRINIDTLTFIGKPTNFKSNIRLITDNASEISGLAAFNFDNKIPSYNIDLETKNLDVQYFTSIKTIINSKIKILGSGFSPSDMSADISFTSKNSYIGNSYLDLLKLTTNAENGIITSNIELSMDSVTTLNLASNLNLTIIEDPAYSLEASVRNINIGNIISSEDLESRFNFELQIEGTGFNPDSMNLFLIMNLYDSFIYDFNVDSTALILDVRRNDNGKKIINVVSDLADLTISGQYSVSSLADVISAEAELFQKSVLEKYSFLLPQKAELDAIPMSDSKKIIDLEHISLEYLVDFKEFLTIKFDSSEIEIDGSITGKIQVQEDSITFSSNVDVDYFKYWNNVDLYFLTRTEIEIELWNQIKNSSIDDFSAFLFFRTNRLYAGSNFYDIGFRTEIEPDSISFFINSKLEDYLQINLQGNFDVDEDRKQLVGLFDKLNISYNNLDTKNVNNIIVKYSESGIDIEDFNMALSGGRLTISGNVGFDNPGVLRLAAKDIQWREIGREVLDIEDENNFDSEISLEGELTGSIFDPELRMGIKLDNLLYQDKKLGTIQSDFNLVKNLLNTNIVFIDSVRTIESPKLNILGVIPIQLASDKTESDSELIDLKIISEDFNLSSLGNVVPFVDDLTGMFNTNIEIGGTIKNPVIIGYLNISNASFKAEANNLRYNFNTKIALKHDQILVEELQLGNVIGTKYGGSLIGSGEILLDKLTLATADFKLKGDLKVLDKISREASPLVYGDLAFETDGEIHLKIDDQSSFVDVPINVTVADLNFQILQTAYQNTSGFIYRFPEIIDSLKLKESTLDSLIRVAEQNKLKQSDEEIKPGYFDYRVRINMQTEAKMVVVLSKELNQNLITVMDGNFELTSRDGRTFSTGQLNLLEGSKLSFIKSFDVTGNVRFEKLDNPLLNIVATYRDYYYPADTTGTAEEVEVAVKIKFNGPLSELAQNFIRDEENIAVYVGSENIENNERDPTKSTSDAFLFMIAGKFTDGATTQEINAAANTAANLAGSVLGGVLNRYLGDYVRSVQLRQVGSETKFNLIGRAGKFRYEIGGSTDVFQDLSRANVKIELPLIQRLLLRLERKEAINETTLSNDMFNELGLKYRFEF